jgi:hypothetical protein
MPLYVYTWAIEEEGRRRGNMKQRRSKTMAFERQVWRV